MVDTVDRIDAREAHRRMLAGALLVCAYDDTGKYLANHLDGAMALAQFRSQEDSLRKDQEIIFYCA